MRQLLADSKWVDKWLFWSLAGLGISCFSRVAPNGLEALFFWSLSFASLGTMISKASLIRAAACEVLPLTMGWFGLFVLMALSLLWSPWEQGTQILFEYRVLLVSVLVALAIVMSGADYRALMRLFWFAGFIGVVSLFLKHGGVFDNQLQVLRPRGSHIIGGLVSSTFVVLSLVLWIEGYGHRLRPFYMLGAILASAEVLFLEIGRMGFVQITAVWLCFGYLAIKGKNHLLWLFGFVIVLVAVLLLSNEIIAGLDRAYQNAKLWGAGAQQYSSMGARLDWITWAFTKGLEKPLFGVGVGNYLASIKSAYESGDLRFLTDNLHSEFANIFLMTGAFGIVLFVGHFLIIVWLGNRSGFRTSGFLATATVGIFLLHCVANSTFKDFGEKNLLVAILPLVSVYVLKSYDRVLDVRQ